ncbi:MAG: metal-dependent hydrolase [Nitrosomonas sp.]|nr:metal-dependent hydrolase [Nitrosomonas sp.]
MPFTPYHMGPGLLIKSVMQSSFSLVIYGWAQIVMDIQPLMVLLTGKGQLHGFSHTYLGATLLAIVAAFTGKYLIEACLKSLGTYNPFKATLFTWRVVFFSAFLGTFTHVLLDSIMHADMKPFYPLAIENKLLGVLTIEQLHQFCGYSGVLGMVIYILVLLKVKKVN